MCRVTVARRRQDDLEYAHQQLEAAYGERQNINDQLRISTARLDDRSHEAVGQHFLNLDIGLPFAQIRPLLRGVPAEPGSAAAVAVEAVNRRGRAITVRVAASPLAARNPGGDNDGALIVMAADALLDMSVDAV